MVSEVNTIEVFFSTPTQPRITVSSFKRKKNESLCLKRTYELESLEKHSFSTKNNYALVVTGKGLLSKTSNSRSEGEALVKENFPQINISEFHYQIDQLKDLKLITIVRKEQLSLLFKFLPRESLISFHMGVAGFAPLIRESCAVANYQLSFSESNLTEVKSLNTRNEASTKLNDNTYNSDDIVHELNAASTLFGIKPYYSSNADFLEQNQSQRIESIIMKKGGIVALAFTLVFVLGNFIVFSKVDKQLNELTQKKLSVEKEMRQLKSKKLRLIERQEFFKKLNFKQESQFTKITDFIASKSNNNIVLNSINIHPLIEQTKTKSKIEFDSKAITITGIALNSLGFKEFTQSLNQCSLFNRVKMTRFTKNHRSNDYDFELHAEINDQ
jgi:Tfp pilus assembly protein PilN